MQSSDAVKGSKKSLYKVQTMCDVLNDYPGIKRMLSEVHKLMKLYYTVPVITASAGRSFSCLRWIKTYLRNSMTQPRPNYCMLLQVHRMRTDNLVTVAIGREFVRRNERRITFFGHF